MLLFLLKENNGIHFFLEYFPYSKWVYVRNVLYCKYSRLSSAAVVISTLRLKFFAAIGDRA